MAPLGWGLRNYSGPLPSLEYEAEVARRTLFVSHRWRYRQLAFLAEQRGASVLVLRVLQPGTEWEWEPEGIEFEVSAHELPAFRDAVNAAIKLAAESASKGARCSEALAIRDTGTG